MSKEAEAAGERALDTLKQRVFATAFSSIDPKYTLDRYYQAFEQPDETAEDGVQEWEPQTEADVQEMLNEARRLGIIA